MGNGRSRAEIERHVERFDPWDKELAADSDLFWRVVDRIRETGPVRRSEACGGFWIISGHDEVLRANKDWQTYSSAQGVTIPNNPDVPMLAPIEVDPPEHHDWRRMLNPLMSRPAVARHEPGMRRIAADLIDAFAAAGECDLAKDYAWQLVPTALFQLMLGVPVDQVPYTRDLVHKIVSFETLELQRQAFADLTEWANGFLTLRAGQPAQGDVTDALIHGTVGGRPLTQDERVNTAILLVLAGMETTSSSICDVAAHLIEDPSLACHFTGPDAPVELAVEELLRHGSISYGLTRVTTRDVEIDGHTIPAGDRVFLLWASANRDPAVFPEPARFDVGRATTAHLAFGAGPHRCMGANFARLTLKVAVTEMVARMPGLRLRPGASVEHPPGVTRSTRSMPVLFEPTPSPGLNATAGRP
jgi:cytochrome P450